MNQLEEAVQRAVVDAVIKLSRIPRILRHQIINAIVGELEDLRISMPVTLALDYHAKLDFEQLYPFVRLDWRVGSTYTAPWHRLNYRLPESFRPEPAKPPESEEPEDDYSDWPLH